MMNRVFTALLVFMVSIPALAADQSTSEQWPTIAKNQERELPGLAVRQRPGTVETLVCNESECPCPGWEITYEAVCRTDANGLKYCENGHMFRECSWKTQLNGLIACKTCL